MKNRIKAFVKKRMLLCWIIMMSVVLFEMMIAFADYPKTLSSMKRVIASTSDKGTMFSSNILVEGGNRSYAIQYKLELDDDEKATGSYDVDVYFWNHSIKDIYTKYPVPIDYTLSFQFTNSRGDPLGASQVGGRSVVITDGSNHSVTLNSSCLGSSALTGSDRDILSQTLPVNAVHNSLKLEFDGNWDLENDTDICVQVLAVPDRSGGLYSDLTDLGAVIGLKEDNESAGLSGWTSYLNEHTEGDTRSFDQFDGYNLIVEGSGEETIKITLDTRYIQFNKNFYGNAELTEVDCDSPYDVMTIAANSNLNRGNDDENPVYRSRYNIQLYKTGEEFPSFSDPWAFFKVKKAGEADPEGWSNALVKVVIGTTT